MSVSWLKRIVRRGGQQTVRNHLDRELAVRIEERAELATQELHAYVDARLAELNGSRPSPAPHIEQRAILATQEAKAYADGAIYSLSMALRAMSVVVTGLSLRIENCEAALTEGDNLNSSAVDGELRRLSEHVDDMRTSLLEVDSKIIKISDNINAHSASDRPNSTIPTRS